jgi:hypothetical protein
MIPGQTQKELLSIPNGNASWNLGMDFYANCLRRKRFILYTDHKPLETLGYLHKKTLNRQQIAMNEFDMEIKYKKKNQHAS